MGEKSSSGGGIGCAGTLLMWLLLLTFIGWAGYGMDPRAAGEWALATMPYVCMGIAGVLGCLAFAYVVFSE